MTMLPKIAAGVTALVGGKMLLDGKDFEHAVSSHEDMWKTYEAYQGDTLHFRNTYSPYTWAEKLNHWLKRETNFMSIWRPWIYIKGTMNYIWENLIPIGLISTGLIYGLGSSYSNVMSKGGSLLKPMLKGGSTLLKSFATAGYTAVSSGVSAIARNIQLPKTITPKGAIATTAITGGLLYIFKTLNDELNGRNQEKYCGGMFNGPPEE